MTPDVPLVRRTAASADFFDAARDGHLLLRRCRPCKVVRGPQETVCPACYAVEHTAVAASGRATLVSWSLVHRSPVPGIAAPYTAGIVEVEEGPWLLTRVLTARDETLVAGQPLTVLVAPGAADGEPLVLARTSRA